MQILRLFMITIGFMAAAALMACGKPASIKGNEYQLLNAPNNAEITIAFSDTENKYFGRVMNRYFGSYEMKGHNLTFGPTASTMMMGPEPLMQAESQYFQDLAHVVRYKASSDGLVLILSDKKELTFKKISSDKNQ